ncbi:hypothetical protein MesoLj113c_14460 [Mesorhizobium sp. 113-3-9]|uniref:hypothetical protein n=1 Tax=Mesorhizobium sp. 113-3-9 TaxID=2744517 RepID=UPI001928BC0E|nr:hypothetical protein [Mesorhizobium sp. 113-3-9]BCG85336.1 hypothetical protein MesoLj113c_14460 [Mesorhizobium sp. 113-3-9]
MDRFLEVLKRIADSMPAEKDLLDLQAQQTMAAWAEPMFWATIASVFVAFAALCGAFASLMYTQKQIRDAREIGENQTQAYVHASAAVFAGSGSVIVTCKNSGLTPATHFSLNAEARIVKRTKVASSISFRNDQFQTWSALGSNDALTVGLLHSDPEVSRFIRGAGIESDDLLLITGQIIYCTIFNHDHLTQFAFYVEPKQTAFRRPTANLTTFWRLPASGLPAQRPLATIVFGENEPRPPIVP